MSGDRVIIVYLRRPMKSNPHEKRSDPFWEFGSFGITRCHDKNLMNPKNADQLRGVRLGFAQGGNQGARLLYLTAPVEVIEHADRLEAKWSPPDMPFRYSHAPILESNNGHSDFPLLAASIKGGGSTREGRSSSCFRSRKTPIQGPPVVKEIIRVYARFRRKAEESDLSSSYVDSLPWPPPLVDPDRHRTYTQKLEDARGARTRGMCGRTKAPEQQCPRNDGCGRS